MTDKIDAHSESNKMKKKAGSDLSRIITDKLSSLKKDGSIESFESDVNFPHKSFVYKQQFKANFLIRTSDGKYIVVRSTNSFKGDRVKTSFFDLEGINTHANFSDEIIASVFLVSDRELEKTSFPNFRKKILNKERYSPATHLLSLSELIEFLEDYNYNSLSTIEEDEGLSGIDLQNYFDVDIAKQKFSTVAEEGSFYGRSGNKLEKDLVKILSDEANLISLKKGKLTGHSFYKEILVAILSNKKINIEEVLKVKATNSVVLLGRGGNAKTDIVLTVKTSSGLSFNENISIKNSTQARVSCHDYRAEDFIRVMNCENSVFADYFNLFQKYGNYTDFNENLPAGYSLEEFKNLLLGSWPMFGEWVLTGKHDKENLVDPNTQISNYLFMLNPNNRSFSFYSMKEYLDLIYKEKSGKLGVPFSWTYPSSNQGERIQLKMPIIHR